MGQAYGSGSITPRGKGVWRLRVRTGTDPRTGRQRFETETFHGSSKQAHWRLAEMVAAANAPGAPKTSETVGDLIAAWFNVAELARRTRDNYRKAIDTLPDRFLNAQASNVGARDLDLLYANLRRDGVKPNPLLTIHTVLSAAYSQGVRWGTVNTNPARDARTPTIIRRKREAPPLDTLPRLLEAAGDDPPTRVWLQVAAFTGARRSEVLALRWSDVDLDTGALHIEGALERDGSRKTTKTGKNRTVPIGPALVAELRTWRRQQLERAFACGGRVVADAYVFSFRIDGSRPWLPESVTARFARLRAKAGIEPTVRLHDLRHGAATRMLAAGFELPMVAQRLGQHPNTTLATYAHVLPGRQREAAEWLEREIGAPNGHAR